MSDDVSSTDPPAEYETEPVSEQSSGGVGIASAGEKALLLKDCHPWTTRANELVLEDLNVDFDVLNSSSLAETDLKQYAMLVLPSTQDETYYQRLQNNSDAIDSFVSGGGTLVAHVATNGWPCGPRRSYSYLPRGVTNAALIDEYVSIEAESHPVVDGISDAAMDHWNQSVINVLRGVPEDATTVTTVTGSGEQSYVQYAHGDGSVLATGHPIEWPWKYGYGTKRLLRNELEYAFSGIEPGSSSVSASVTTLQFIPGESENPSEDGNPMDSGLMQVFPANDSFSVWGVDVELPTEPVFDNWLGGDMIDVLPKRLQSARKKKEGKYRADTEEGAEFRQYRFENGVDVSFETAGDGRIDEETVEITFSETGSDGTDSTVIRGDQENSKTVLHDAAINGIPWRQWYGKNVRRSNRHRRYYSYDTDFEFDGTSGVRVLTVWGGYAGFVADISQRTADDPAAFFKTVWNWDISAKLAELAIANGPEELQFLIDALTAVPNTYSFLDLVVLADGRRYARVWDASQYPSLFTYVDGKLAASEQMPYEPKQWWNLDMTAFHLMAILGATPYTSMGDRTWEQLVRTRGTLDRIEDDIKEMLNVIPPGWDSADFMPTVPRVTVGFESADHDKPVDTPSEPFPRAEDIVFPWSESLPPN